MLPAAVLLARFVMLLVAAIAAIIEVARRRLVVRRRLTDARRAQPLDTTEAARTGRRRGSERVNEDGVERGLEAGEAEVADTAGCRQQLEGLSIRARMAVAVACFERALRQLGAVTPEMVTLLEVLWQFPTASDLGAWEDDLKYAAAPGLAWRHTVEGAEDVIWEGIDPRLRRLYEDVEEVGRGNLYSGTRSETTLEPLVLVIEATRALGVTPPSPLPLRRFTFAENHGWGRPIRNAARRLGP